MNLSISAVSADKAREALVIHKLEKSHLFASLMQLSFTSLGELANAALRGDIDILLIDAEPTNREGDGVEFVNGLLQRGADMQVIFFASTEASFNLNMYQQKPTFFLPLDEPEEKAVWALEHACDLARRRSQRPLCIQNRNKVILVHPKDIAYIESDRRILHIHVGRELVDTYGKLSEVERQLPSSFVQCHKSFLVNLVHVKEQGADSFVLKTGDVVPISQQRRKLARKRLLEYLQEVSG